MPQSQIKLYYKNVTAEIIGEENGITPEQLKSLSEKTSPLIGKLNEERKAGKKTESKGLPNKRTCKECCKKIN